MTRPNVIVMHCHDLGRHLHHLGARTVTSPRLDGLAGDGVTFTQMFATAPQCSPSRASMFTGRWPHRNGVMGLTHRGFAWDLHDDEVHLADHLHRAGYATEAIGVVHECRTRTDDELAARLGFDRVETGGLADDVADRAIAAIGRLAAPVGAPDPTPFYLQVGFIEPHRIEGRHDPEGTLGFIGDHIEPDDERGVDVPDYLRPTDTAREEVAELQGAIRHLDAAVGRVLDGLHAAGVADDTLVLFTTDHGLALPRAKCSLYDPGLEVACIVRWPGRGWIGGRRVDQPCSSLDLTPTVLDAVGVRPTGEAPVIDGASLVERLDDDVPADRDLRTDDALFGEMTYHDYYDPRRSIRTPRWKLIANFSSAPGFMDPSQSWFRRSQPIAGATHSWRRSHPRFELYDLRADPLELVDLAPDPSHATVFAELRHRLHAWMVRTADPLIDGAVTSPLHDHTMTELSDPVS